MDQLNNNTHLQVSLATSYEFINNTNTKHGSLI